MSLDPGSLEVDELALGDGILGVVTTRHGGVSAGPYASLNLGDHVGDDPAAVRANRDRVCEALGVDRLTIADQVHGATVAVVDARLAGMGHGGDAESKRFLPATDGLVTDVPGAALAVLVADCQPIVLWDPAHRALGVAHAGRRGVVLGVVPAVVGVLADRYGTRPADLVVAVGPHIGAASYEVGPAEVGEVEAALPGLCSPTAAGHATVDLAGGVRRQLAALGVPSAQVQVSPADTRTSTGRYFSDRAERPCGRFALVAAIRS